MKKILAIIFTLISISSFSQGTITDFIESMEYVNTDSFKLAGDYLYLKHLVLKSENNGKIAKQQGDSVIWGEATVTTDTTLTGNGTISNPLKVDTTIIVTKSDLTTELASYLTSEVDGSISNEIQDLSRTGNTLSLSNDASTVDLSDLVNPDLSGYATTTQLTNQLSQTISNGITTKSPSEDAVYDALTGKASISGTDNYIPKITGANTLGNSFLFQDASFMKTTVDFKFEKSAPGFYFKDSHSNYSGFFYVYDSLFGIQKRNYDTDAYISNPYGFSLAAPHNTINVNNLGNVAFGHATALAKLHPISTGTQLRLGYNATKYTDISTGSTGNLIIDPTGDKLSIAEKTGINEIGGVMVKLTNKTGASSVKGTVVYVNPSVNNAFGVNPINGDMPFGVVYDNGVADGSECWVVVSGIAEVLLVNTVASTRSYIAYSSSSVAGRIDIAASVPAADAHFREIGHTLESKAGGTNVLCKCVLHFN